MHIYIYIILFLTKRTENVKIFHLNFWVRHWQSPTEVILVKYISKIKDNQLSFQDIDKYATVQ